MDMFANVSSLLQSSILLGDAFLRIALKLVLKHAESGGAK